MSGPYKTLLCVWGEDAALAAKRVLEGSDIYVMAVGRMHVVRVEQIIVQRPPRTLSAVEQAQYQRWLEEWLPTRLVPPHTGRIIHL